MSAASDIILLSSPPVCPSRTPAPPSYDPGKIFGISPRGSSPASVLSPSELFRPLSQSRYFKASTKNGKTSNIKKNKTSSEGAAETNLLNFKRKDAVLENGAKRRRTKKLSSERVTVPSELEPSTPDRRGNTSKKSTATKKKHTDGPSKCGKTTNKTLTGRIAKADSVQTRKSDEKIDCPCTPKSSQEKIAKGTFGWEKEGLQLDVATKRRFDWTPTKDTIDQATEVEEIGSAERPSNRFGTLLAEYNFSDSSSAAHNNTRSLEAGAFTKRRRIELVDSSLNPVSKAIAPSTDKPLTDNDQSTTAYKPKKRLQKQSKKLTTLTARVTARYNEDLAEIPDLTATHKDGTSANTKSSKSKAREKTKSAPQEPEFIVLSPEAATKCLDDQDLIFGTCSQLQREDSPKLRRETQTAFYESEKSNTAEPVSSHIQSTRSKTSSSTTISRFTAPRNLWSIAARDSEGSLAQVAVLNLSGESGLSETSATNYNHTSRQKSRNKDAGTVGSIGSNDISEPNEISSTKKGLSTGASQIINNTTEKTNSQTAVPRPTMPRYGGFTDAELSKQIATYGFKPLRNRQKMIELLQKCWESKHGKDSNGDNEKEQRNLSTEPTSETAPSQLQKSEKSSCKCTSTSQKTTTRPRKAQSTISSKSISKNEPSATSANMSNRRDSPQRETKKACSTRSFIDVEEIEDSEEDVTLSPVRHQHQHMLHTAECTPSLSLSTMPSNPIRTAFQVRSPALTATKRTNTSNLADQITRAVRAQPQFTSTSTPKHISWYEKMLMYNPINLESFTTWLNTEGLSLVNEDREVGASFVRKWCENRGICCSYY